MISDFRLRLNAFLATRFIALKSEIYILKPKIAGLHYSNRLPHQGKTSSRGRSKPDPGFFIRV
jgi:hypothetical protein